ncbi:hypothetical protein G6F32_015611 [Rhizopus arrhizus]|nr:hypothetical protein G6F32_015611 [Rhizopus arrhizus]
MRAEFVVEAVKAGGCVGQLRLRDQRQSLAQLERLARFDTQPVAVSSAAALQLASQPGIQVALEPGCLGLGVDIEPILAVPGQRRCQAIGGSVDRAVAIRRKHVRVGLAVLKGYAAH